MNHVQINMDFLNFAEMRRPTVEMLLCCNQSLKETVKRLLLEAEPGSHSFTCSDSTVLHPRFVRAKVVVAMACCSINEPCMH